MIEGGQKGRREEEDEGETGWYRGTVLDNSN
jgi:hypothetical protein